MAKDAWQTQQGEGGQSAQESMCLLWMALSSIVIPILMSLLEATSLVRPQCHNTVSLYLIIYPSEEASLFPKGDLIYKRATLISIYITRVVSPGSFPGFPNARSQWLLTPPGLESSQPKSYNDKPCQI